MTELYDILILGGGCAGLTAAIYAGRAGMRTLILESAVPGGQAATAGTVENYPGIPQITGPALMEHLLKQALSFGAELRISPVTRLSLDGPVKEVAAGDVLYWARAVILATGAVPQRAGFEGEEAFLGRGVSYCATCDGPFFRGRAVLVVGGGNSSAGEALHLAEAAESVTMLVRRDALRCEETLAQRLRSSPRIHIRFRTRLLGVGGEGRVQWAETEDLRTGAVTRQHEAAGLGIFVFAGCRPASALFHGQIQMDGQGYVLTDSDLQTSIPGVFAAGDIRAHALRQLVTAAADGALAAVNAADFVRHKQENRRT